jgi:hypothetical protein
MYLLKRLKHYADPPLVSLMFYSEKGLFLPILTEIRNKGTIPSYN